jgi:hypothetical protein
MFLAYHNKRYLCKVETPVTRVEIPKLSKVHQFLLNLLGGLITFIFGVSFFCSVVRSLFFGCFAWTCAPPRTFSLLEWDIPESYYPENAKIGGFSASTEPDGWVENGSQTVYWVPGNGLGIYIAERLATSQHARSRFNGRYARLENSEGISTDFISGIANKSKIRCGYPVSGGYACFFTAHYEEYVIYFRATIDRKMTMNEFKAIVQYLDQQVICDLYEICEGGK